MLICNFFSKFINEVTSIIFGRCDNYSGTQHNSTCTAGSAQKRKMHGELEKLHLEHVLSHKSFAGCFTKNKNR